MPLKIARGLFLFVALAVSAVAVQTWSEPGTQVLSGVSVLSDCRIPANVHNKMRSPTRPGQDLLLVMFSLSQALKS